MNPLVSIIITFYNSGDKVHQIFKNLQEQTYNNLEFICVNDGSKDNTLELLEIYQKEDSRIKLFTKKNEGAAHLAKYLGQQKAKGDFIFLLDHDDEVSPSYIESAIEVFQKNPQLDLVSGILEYVLPNGETKSRNRLFAKNEEIENQDSNLIENGKDIFTETLGKFNVAFVGLWKAEIFKSVPYNSVPAWVRGDEVIYRKLLLNTNKVGICDGVYFYKLDPESTAQKINIRQIEVLETDRVSRDLSFEQNVYDRIKAKFEKIALKNLIKVSKIYFLEKNKYPKETQKKYFEIIKSNFLLIKKHAKLSFYSSLKTKAYYSLLLINFKVFMAYIFLKIKLTSKS